MYLCTSIFCFFFFFKQKTAYEMRISDWSSDVCSSDLFVMGFAYGPLGGWLPSLFPPGVRYTGTSMSFNLGGIVGGGLAPMIAQALADHGGLGHIGFYLVAAGALSLLSLAILRSEEHTSELQSLMRIPYAVFRVKKKKILTTTPLHHTRLN